ncbi:MAG: hypothetical protein RR642_14450 [Solibacillus sp.]
MLRHKADIESGTGIAVEVKGDMRDKLVANLRNQTKQSRANRQARVHAERQVPARKLGAVTARISLVEGEPQAVLIKNRSENLANDVHRLRSRYANLLTEDVNE